jgi:hypothetical protein
MTKFRSWVEDYRPPEPPIDREAFKYRRMQRRFTQAADARPVTAQRLQQKNALYFADRELREQRENALRRADPVLCAQLHLQRSGYIVVRADIVRPDLRGWMVGSRQEPLTDDQLIALAEARGLDREKTA